ncbi:porin [Ideonella sp. DXS29W]|uniref:Porin n=1 Tax=Ideonella lacteola TaxID=2984193 RepID=A0ABU9BHQ6_9BURK
MKFPLTAAGLAACSCLGAAWAQTPPTSQVSVYGTLDVAVAQRQLAAQDAVRNVDSGLMETSHLGFRGSEDLGGGLKAQFDVSTFLRPDTGESTRGIPGEAFWSRSAWVGLSGDWGQVRLGRMSTLNFVNMMRFSPFGPAAGLNPVFLHTYIGSAAQPLTTIAGATDSGWNNTLAYTSPNWAGLTVAAQAAPSEGGPAGRRWGGSVVYAPAGQPLAMAVVYDRTERASLTFPLAFPTLGGAVPPLTGQQFSMWQLAASWDFGVAKVFGQWFDGQIDGTRPGPPPPDKTLKLRTWQLGATVPWGSGALLASVAQSRRDLSAGGSSDAQDATRTTVSMGYDYSLSKRTDLYAVGMSDRVTRLDGGTTWALGARHRF